MPHGLSQDGRTALVAGAVCLPRVMFSLQNWTLSLPNQLLKKFSHNFMFSILNVHWLKEQEYSQLFFSIFIRCIFSSKQLVVVYIHNNVTYMYMCVCVCVCVCICISEYLN